MKYLLLALVFFLISTIALSQKKVINISDFENWPKLSPPQISNNGKFVMFTQNEDGAVEQHLRIIDVDNDWKIDVQGKKITSTGFSDDNRYALFKKSDSLGVVRLGKSEVKFYHEVSDFKMTHNEKKPFLGIINEHHELTIQDLNFHQNCRINEVEDFDFTSDGEAVVAIVNNKDAGTARQILWIDLIKNTKSIIWTGQSELQYFLSPTSQYLAFNCINGSQCSIYYFKPGMAKASALVTNNDKAIPNDFSLAGEQLLFSKTGLKILFRLRKKDLGKVVNLGSSRNLKLWRYNDAKELSPIQSSRVRAQFICGIADINNKKIFITDNHNSEDLYIGDGFQKYLTFVKANSRYNYQFRNSSKYCVVSTANGQETQICDLKSALVFRSNNFQLSPDEKFAIWFDSDSLNFFSYEMATGVTRNISNSVRAKFYDINSETNGRREVNYGIAAWDTLNNSVLIYDQYDIWKVDLLSKKIALNITSGIGQAHQTSLGLLQFTNGWSDRTFTANKTLWLTAYDSESKQNGFWRLDRGFKKHPVKSSMDSAFYYVARSPDISPFASVPSTMQPMKAKNADRFIVQKMDFNEYPNYYYTKDFSHFKPLSDLHPEKKYNWISAELFKWKTQKGVTLKGILYKPANLNPNLKYPMIITYYTKRSDELHQYLIPDYCKDRINIPFYVSNGYLIFVSDTYTTSGNTANDIVESVSSAVKVLGQRQYIDIKKIGLQGHSYAGYETNVLITNLNLFAAACEASGVSDQISSYGAVPDNRVDRQASYEFGFQQSGYGKGVTPWLQPFQYVKNSPIFKIENCVTPLLIMHGDNDSAVPFSQAVEMFSNMRRAGKKVWLSQYTGAAHSLDGNNALDYTIRMKQFFDHYLKGAPPPKWMTVSSEQLSQMADPYELDTSGKQP